MFTAELQRQFRDINTLSPKVLLTRITTDGTEFRDHCWVELTQELSKLVPIKCGQKLMIHFHAAVKTYYSGKQTLHKIKNIKIS